MKKDEILLGFLTVPRYTAEVFIVGSGAAGYNAADTLYDMGITDIAIVTEGKYMGTSRNTGSDKQTYYKLNVTGGVPDSVYDMAKSLMRGGSMHGDIALTDAALSARGFFKLVGLGVPFPMNEYGEYVGYKTDHDETTRATSCGPLTSKFMTEALEKQIEKKNIRIFDRYRVIKILEENGKAVGFMTVCPDEITGENPDGIAVFTCGATVYAVGGPSAIYYDTVYPPSQTCALGAAFLAGAAGANLTESQYGIASTDFRWNLSGTYQQVLPRYISTDKDGKNEKEFLRDAFTSDEEMLNAIFSKGYEWPFDPKKTAKGGSSRVDLAVYREKKNGRRVFLDYTRNPSCADKNGRLDTFVLSEKARTYLENSNALLDTPIARLTKMNMPAIDLYKSHGIDLTKDKLEIAVCAQHCNGGLAVKNSRESTTLANFYAVGECAGTFGVYRPGGSALNATQTGSLFACMDIRKKKAAIPDFSQKQLSTVQMTAWTLHMMTGDMTRDEILAKRAEYAKKMSACGAFLRYEDKIRETLAYVEKEIAFFSAHYHIDNPLYLTDVMINYDILVTQMMYLNAILAYIQDGGKSRGSYLILEKEPDDILKVEAEIDETHSAYVENTCMDRCGRVASVFEKVRPLPASEQWFETVWNRYRKENS